MRTVQTPARGLRGVFEMDVARTIAMSLVQAWAAIALAGSHNRPFVGGYAAVRSRVVVPSVGRCTMTTTTAMPRADIAHLSEAPLARLRDRLVRACAHEAAQAHEHRSSASDLIGRTDVDNVLERGV